MNRCLPNHSTRRGLTLIELLMSLTILGSLVAVIITWLNTVAHLHTISAPRHTGIVSAERFMQLIRDDLMAGDFMPPNDSSHNANRVTSITIEPATHALQIRTRIRPHVDQFGRLQSPPGPIIRVYQFDAQAKSIRMQLHEVALHDLRKAGSPVGPTRLVLDQISAWECSLESLGEDDHVTTFLSLSITNQHGVTFAGSFEVYE